MIIVVVHITILGFIILIELLWWNISASKSWLLPALIRRHTFFQINLVAILNRSLIYLPRTLPTSPSIFIFGINAVYFLIRNALLFILRIQFILFLYFSAVVLAIVVNHPGGVVVVVQVDCYLLVFGGRVRRLLPFTAFPFVVGFISLSME